MKLKGDPVRLYWEKASFWRKLILLRSINPRLLGSNIASKYLDEMMLHRRKDGGFSRRKDEEASVTPTAEAIRNMVKVGKESWLQVVQEAIKFLWEIQKENGSWRENPRLSDDKVPFWSSKEKGVPILTADCIEALVEAGYREDERVKRAVSWLKGMQSPSGMWITLEDADPSDTEPDSTQRSVSALLTFGLSRNHPSIMKACKALEWFILKEAEKWEKGHPPVWPWIASLDGLVAAGYSSENEAIRYALKNIYRLQNERGGWPNNYELRVVPTLVRLNIIPKENIFSIIEHLEGEKMGL